MEQRVCIDDYPVDRVQYACGSAMRMTGADMIEVTVSGLDIGPVATARRHHANGAYHSRQTRVVARALKQIDELRIFEMDTNKRIAHLEMPDRMRRLPISDEGYQIPYFVPFVNSRPGVERHGLPRR